MYDGDAILLEYDGANALLATYSHGEEVDQPLAMTRGAESFFYHTDHLGSVRLVTDGAGSVVNSYDYDAFGNLEATSFETVSSPFGFTARERDAESGLMFYRARYFDPEIGRFISQDPIGFAGEDLNLYRYVYNSSINLIDPAGESFAEYSFTKKLVVTAVVSFVSPLSGAFVAYTAAVLATDDPCDILGATWGGTIGGAGLAAGYFVGGLPGIGIGLGTIFASVYWGTVYAERCSAARLG